MFKGIYRNTPKSKFGALIACGLLLAACGSSADKDTDTTINASNNFGRAYGLEAAKTATEKAFAGTYTNVDPTSRPAAKGKHIAVISSGQAVLSHQLPSDAAVAAAKALGWQADLLDAKLNPSAFGDLIRQALATGVDGIVVETLDCDKAVQPLREAKDKKIPVVGIGNYDCDEPFVNAGPPLFSAPINYADLPAKDLGLFAQGLGRDQANYVISQSNASAHVLLLSDPDLIALKHVAAGFTDQVTHSGGTATVVPLEFKSADLGPTLVQQIQAELLKHPEIDWIKSPYSYATLAGVLPAVAAQPGKYKIMGGEGLQPELDALRGGQIDGVCSINSEWLGWASVDSLNSVFRNEPTHPSGAGWQLVDKTHNLTASGPIVSKVDYQAEFKKAWGIS